MDRRTRRSRQALEAALLDLITERELTQISVSDVTGRADVHRTTFYEHYTDVHDLAASACTQMFDQLMAAAAALNVAAGLSEEAAHHALTEVFAQVAAHQTLYRSLLGADGSARVIDHLLERTTESVRESLAASGGERGERGERDERSGRATEPSRALAVLVAGALVGTITDWLRRGCPETPEQLSAAIRPHLFAVATARPA